jgi:hypothetical protein
MAHRGTKARLIAELLRTAKSGVQTVPLCLCAPFYNERPFFKLQKVKKHEISGTNTLVSPNAPIFLLHDQQ